MREMKRALVALMSIALLAIAVPAQAATMVQGGPLTNLSGDKPTNIHLALSGYPTKAGLYIYEAVKPVAGARPTISNTATQLWVGVAGTGAPTDIKGDLVLVVDNGYSWGADCGTQQCGIFIRLDHNAGQDTSEDQFIPLSFQAITTQTVAPISAPITTSLSVSINGVATAANTVGTATYRQVLTFTGVTGDGSKASVKSYTPDLCPVVDNVVAPLKGVGTCDIAVLATGVVQHYPIQLKPAAQSSDVVTPRAIKLGSTYIKLVLPKETSVGETLMYKSATPKICTISGQSFKAIKKGICRFTATAPGSANYNAFNAKVIYTIK